MLEDTARKHPKYGTAEEYNVIKISKKNILGVIFVTTITCRSLERLLEIAEQGNITLKY